MNESFGYGSRTVEISLADIFWSLLRKWRIILVCMLALGIILGGFSFIKEYRNYSNASIKQSRQESYEKKLHDYKIKKEALEVKIENLENRIEFLETARENSLMLKIDPNNTYRIASIYYIDSDYEIIPESVYQNPDYTNALLKGYRNAVQRIDYNNLVRLPGEDELFADPPVAAQTIKRVYATAIDETANLLSVFVYSDTEERANKILNGIETEIGEATKTLSATVGEHSITKISEISEWVVDTDLYKSQSEFQDEYDKVVESLTAAKLDLTKISAPTSTVITKKTVLKKGIKFGLIGLILGFILPILYYVLKLIFQDRLKSTNELVARYNLPVLGSVKMDGRKQNKLDAKISSALGAPNMDSSDMVEYIASNINLRDENSERLLLVGNAAKENMDKFAELLNSTIGNREIVVGGSVKQDSAALSALKDECAVICVEDLQKTRHFDISDEIKIVGASKRNIIGFIVLQ